MFKLLFLLFVSVQIGCISGQLNVANVLGIVGDLERALQGNGSFSLESLGLDTSDPMASLGKLMELRSRYNVGAECMKDAMSFLKGLSDQQEWAMRMIDAIGKPPSGVMQGKIIWIGDWDECLATRAIVYKNATTKEGPQELFTGQYCHVDYQRTTGSQLAPAVTISIGVCLPDSCSSSDVKALVDMLTDVVSPYLNKSLHFVLPKPDSVMCEVRPPWDTRAIVVLVMCSIFAFVMVMATLYDVFYVQWLSKKQPSNTDKCASVYRNGAFESDGGAPVTNGVTLDSVKTSLPTEEISNGGQVVSQADKEPPRRQTQEASIASKILLSFSMFTNGTKLLNTHQPKGALTAVNGIRFLSMSWVIIGHTYDFIMPYTDNQAQMFADFATRFSFMPIFNGEYSVDSFFVLSGLLLTYLTMKELNKCKGAKNFKWGWFYFHRFWRLTPAYMLILLVSTSLSIYWATGPIWTPVRNMGNVCENWWTNLLYINNLVNVDKMCFGWSWYLANDMQFFVISPLMLIPLFHFPVVGGVMCLLFLLTSAISAGLISMHYGLPPNVLFDVSTMSDFLLEYYMKPWCRVGPYAIGVFAGYLLYRCKSKVKIPKFVNLSAWLIASAVGALVVYGVYSEDGTNPFSNEMSAAYHATARNIWGACVAWVIFACATGNGGPVNHILSWPGFVPLGRLSYCAYLVHPIMMDIHDGSIRQLVHAFDYSLIYLTLANLCVSYAAAFMLSLAFEAPMMGLEKVLLGRAKRS